MGGCLNVLWLSMTLHWGFKWNEQFICKFRNSLKKQKLILKLIDLMESIEKKNSQENALGISALTPKT
jgi:hypothetical protein